MNWRLSNSALIILSIVSSTFAQSVPAPEVDEWIRETMRAANKFVPERPVEVVWSVQAHPMSDRAIQELRQAVAGRPDDPRQVELFAQQRRIQHGPDTTTTTLAFGDHRTWRLSSDLPYSPTRFLDDATDGSVRWGMDAESLMIRDANDEVFREKRDAPFGQLRHFVSQGLTMSLGPLAPEELELSTQKSGASWASELRIKGGWRGTLSGTWSPDGIAQIRTIVLFAPDQQRPSFDLVVEDSVKDDVLGVARATAITSRAGPSAIRWQFVRANPIELKQVRKLVQPPDPTGSDSLRGPVTATRLGEYRSGTARLSIKEGQGWKVFSEHALETNRFRLRTAGWALAGACIVILVALRVRALRAPKAIGVSSQKGKEAS